VVRATCPSVAGGAFAVQGEAHGSAPVARAERDAITRAAAIGVQSTAHASAAITRHACRIHSFPFFPSARPLPRLASLAAI
jgi:hypothetical protein